MIKKIDVGYIGFSLTMLSELLCSPFFNLKECILEETRCTDQIRTICKTNHVKLFEARNKKHLSEILIQESEENVFIMYENGIIIENTALCGKHIYNFHSGSFLNNRGAHPIVWSILNNDTFTEMTLHEIDADIDQGTKVDTRAVAIDENDDIDSLKMKLEALIPDLLLSLFNHILRREYFEKQFNRYNRRIELIDYTIDLGKDSMEDIFRKVRSQSAYKGAVLFADEEKIYIHKVKKIGQTGQFYRKENGQKCIEIRQILEILD